MQVGCFVESRNDLKHIEEIKGNWMKLDGEIGFFHIVFFVLLFFANCLARV